MTLSRREEYLNRMEEQLALWSARFEALKTHAGKDAKAQVVGQLERWHAAKEAVAAKLAELKEIVDDTWDAVKLELEKGWQGIEASLNEGLTQAQTRHFTKEELESLTPEQRDAILEAMVVAVVADGNVGQDEVARFDREVGKIPWTQPKAEILEKAQAARARILALTGDAERLAMLSSISARLPPGPIAEKTLGMMAVVMTGDKPGNLAEQHTLAAFALALGITEDRLAAIAASLAVT
jgi:hypothetical protein